VADPTGVARLLAERFRRRVSTDVPERVACARDLWQRHLIALQQGPAVDANRLPAAIVRPETTDEVVALVLLARREGFPLVPFGAGSGVCGGIECDPRTIVVDTKKMHAARRFDAGPRLVVGPGAMGVTLEESLEKDGFTLGHFPSSILCSTVGGWVATRGAGQCSGRYGKIEDMVTGAECVLGNGEVVRFRRRGAGLDLLPLVVGSEGAFGILTELELRLHEAPEERAFAAFTLPDMQRGTAALRRVYQAGLRPAVARLYDPLDSVLLGDTTRENHAPRLRDEGFGRVRSALFRTLLRAPRLLEAGIEAAERTLIERSKLLFVFEGKRDEVAVDAAEAASLVASEGGESLGESPARAWFERRYAVSYKQSPVFRAGIWNDTMEVAAPWSKLDAVYRNVRRALSRHALVMAHMSHAYPDGCSVYFTFVGVSQGTDAEAEHVAVWRDALDATLEAGGVVSHHHGVGRLRKEALARELGRGGVEAHRALKRAWDPSGIMNPGSPFEPGAVSSNGPEPSASNERDAPSERDAPWLIDAASGLVRLKGDVRLDHAERALGEQGLTLGLETVPSVTVDAWIASGMAGLPDIWLDPVEQRLAGLEAVLANGARLEQRPAPRRATGPDLSALFVGAEGRVGKVEHIWLRARARGAQRARALDWHGERDPALSEAERQAFERVVEAIAR
jgi:alkyldihydroxyacetonephosphate synthase